MEDYITIDEAARRAGYRDSNNLRTAARAGRLQTVLLGPRARMTTPAWLDAYLASVRPGNYKRGQERKPEGQDVGGAGGE